MNIKQKLQKAVEKVSGNAEFSIETPQYSDHGDYSANVAMQLFPTLQGRTFNGREVNSPRELAEELVQKLSSDESLAEIVEKIEVAGPGFINFFIKQEYLIKELQTVLNEGDKYGTSDVGKGKKYLIEHTSPNPNKAMHLGHLRNNILGMAIANLWEATGVEVTRDAIDNNRGIAIARLMWGYLKFARKDGDKNADVNYWYEHQDEWLTPESAGVRPDRFMDDLYVKASEDFKNDKDVEKRVREMVVSWEAKDEVIWALWEKVLSYVYEGQKKTLDRLANKWDYVWHEHEHYQMGKDLVEEGLKKGVFKKGDMGALVTNLSKYNIPDTVVIKADGTALYITQDLALTKLKKEKFNPDRLHWVIGPEQSLALKQMFAACEQLGIVKYEDCVHISYGYMSIKGKGKMSSRAGTVIYIDELLDKAVDAVRNLMTNTDIDNEKQKRISEAVGVGAVKYSILKVGRNQDTAFDINESVALEGNSGPYLQYTYARCQSVLEKSKSTKGQESKSNTNRHSEFISESDLGKILKQVQDDKSVSQNDTVKLNDEELALLRSYPNYSEIIANAAKSYSPNLLCNYLYDLAQKYNTYYNAHKIVGGENETVGLALTAATGIILRNGLNLLGIVSPQKM